MRDYKEDYEHALAVISDQAERLHRYAELRRLAKELAVAWLSDGGKTTHARAVLEWMRENPEP